MTKQEKLEAIARMEQELAKLKQDLKQPEFRWQYKVGQTFMLCINNIIGNCAVNNKSNLEFGIYRTTRENAEKSLLRNKRTNRLEALVEQLQGNLEGDYSIYLGITWDYGLRGIKQPGVVTMQQETAIAICEMLSTGEFSLEGEL